MSNKFFIGLRNALILSAIFWLMLIKAFAADPPMQLYDEGVLQGTIFKINCVGDGIVCTKSGITGIITVNSVVPPATNYLTFSSAVLTFGGSKLTFVP